MFADCGQMNFLLREFSATYAVVGSPHYVLLLFLNYCPFDGFPLREICAILEGVLIPIWVPCWRDTTINEDLEWHSICCAEVFRIPAIQLDGTPFGSPGILIVRSPAWSRFPKCWYRFHVPSLHPQVLPWIYIDVDAVCKGKCWYIVSWITSWAKEHPRSPESLIALMRHNDRQFPNSSQLTWVLYEHLIHFVQPVRLITVDLVLQQWLLCMWDSRTCALCTSLSSGKFMHVMIICWGNSRRTGQWTARKIVVLAT